MSDQPENEKPEPPPKRRWYQYSLRSLLIFMLVAGVLLAWIGELFVGSYKQRELEAKHQQLEAKWNKFGVFHIQCSQGNLESLYFIDVTDAALKELGGVTSLEHLTLKYQNTRFIDSNLENLIHMKHLKIGGEQVSDLSPLKDLTNLELLDLSGNLAVKDLSPLKGLKNLKNLGLYATTVGDLSPLNGLTDLKVLSLLFNPVTDLSPLKNLKNLEELYLDYTQVSDLSPLKGLMKLNSLRLENTQVTDLTPLESLTNLRDLRLSGTPVSKEEVHRLQKALPNCKIRWYFE